MYVHMYIVVNKERFIAVADARDGAYHAAFTARQLHDLHKCI